MSLIFRGFPSRDDLFRLRKAAWNTNLFRHGEEVAGMVLLGVQIDVRNATGDCDKGVTDRRGA